MLQRIFKHPRVYLLGIPLGAFMTFLTHVGQTGEAINEALLFGNVESWPLFVRQPNLLIDLPITCLMFCLLLKLMVTGLQGAANQTLTDRQIFAIGTLWASSFLGVIGCQLGAVMGISFFLFGTIAGTGVMLVGWTLTVGIPTYRRSRQQAAAIDREVELFRRKLDQQL
jgi:hypothetical protein